MIIKVVEPAGSLGRMKSSPNNEGPSLEQAVVLPKRSSSSPSSSSPPSPSTSTDILDLEIHIELQDDYPSDRLNNKNGKKSKKLIFFHPGQILDNRFLIRELIGSGGFGRVYEARDLTSPKDTHVAVKLSTTKAKRMCPVATPIHLEFFILESRTKGLEGFPETYYIGYTRAQQPLLIMDLLGPSLEDLFAMCGNRFSICTTLLIVDQLLQRLEDLHNSGVIHRDLKPGNIVIGRGPKNKNVIYLIDFGLSQVMQNGLELIDPEQQVNLYIGTPNYMPLRAHRLLKQSKRDDLESLVYVIAYFVNLGELPWDIALDDLSDNADEYVMHDVIYETKKNTNMTQLFARFPKHFAMFADMVMELKVNEEPAYDEYRKLFRKLGEMLRVDYGEKKFDWARFYEDS